MGLLSTAVKSAVKAASSAASSAVKSSSKGSSSSSRGSSSGSSGGGSYAYTDSDFKTRYSDESGTDWAAAYQKAYNQGDLAGMRTALQNRSNKLGGKNDSWQTWAENSLNRYESNLRQPTDVIRDQTRQDTDRYMQQYQQDTDRYMQQYQQQTDYYMEQYRAMQDAIRREQQAKIDANVSALNSQRANIRQAGAQANAAAQQNYYQLINPNGASAEQRAALGLSNSGLTESSQIAAGNAYLSAVNANQQTVDNQMTQIDLAIQQAKLSGDLATAQQLQSYYDTVVQQGMQQAHNIAALGQQNAQLAANLSQQNSQFAAGLGQWGVENAQQQAQQAAQNGINIAGLTGIYNGQPTLAGQQNSVTIQGIQLDNQIKQLSYLIQQQYGMSQAAAELEAMRIANEGAKLGNAGAHLDNIRRQLENQMQQLQIDYAKKQM